MDISNSIYYTLSTISQVIAAFIALSGVFVIFKIQELKKLQFLQVKLFCNYLNDLPGLTLEGTFNNQIPTISLPLNILQRAECLGGMKDEMTSILNNDIVQKSIKLKQLSSWKSIFDIVDNVRLKILQFTRCSILSGLITIIYCLLGLILAPWLSQYNAVYVYTGAFIGLLISLTCMVVVICESLKEKNYLKLK